MSVWTHAICDDCWDRLNPDKPSPRTGYDRTGPEEMRERCCWCLSQTANGIYTRADPATLGCGGEHR